MRNSKFKVKSEKLKVDGFGLIETLIACGIVAMMGAASVGLSNSIIKNNRLGYQKIIATNLASEAIEIAHWIRDKNTSDGLDTTDWLSSGNPINLNLNSCTAADPCGINPVERSALATASAGFYYTQSPDTITVDNIDYVREIAVNYADNGNELKITAKVSVNNNSLAEVSSVLTNWK